jgi:hypothetical protein
MSEDRLQIAIQNPRNVKISFNQLNTSIESSFFLWNMQTGPDSVFKMIATKLCGIPRNNTALRSDSDGYSARFRFSWAISELNYLISRKGKWPILLNDWLRRQNDYGHNRTGRKLLFKIEAIKKLNRNSWSNGIELLPGQNKCKSLGWTGAIMGIAHGSEHGIWQIEIFKVARTWRRSCISWIGWLSPEKL